MPLDIETLKQVDLTAPRNAISIAETTTISDGSTDSFNILNNIYPDDIIYVEFDVSCIDVAAADFWVYVQNDSGNITAYLAHSGEPSSSGGRARIAGSFHTTGRRAAGGDSLDEFGWDGIEFVVENTAGSSSRYAVTVNCFLLHRDFLSRKRSGTGDNPGGDFNYYGSNLEGFD